MNGITELGKLVAEQMENIEHDFHGRLEDFEYEGSISLLVYKDKANDSLQIRQRTSMCRICCIKVLVEACSQFSSELPCSGEEHL